MPDLHSQMLLEQYHEQLPKFEKLRSIAIDLLNEQLRSSGIEVSSVSARIKTEDSLKGKLMLKGSKYASLDDITDILGARVVTFYADDVDRIASIAEKSFVIDWQNSIDKRTLHRLDSFGYNSLHYICSLPHSVVEKYYVAELENIRFELQMRTILQHAWASLNHDNGYKSGLEVPPEYMRSINRLAGLLELADNEFSRIRTELNMYRHRVHALVQNGQLDEVQLDGDTFRSYLQTKPFDSLNRKIAAINQAEIIEVSLLDYLPALKQLGCDTLADVEKLRQDNSADAYWLARHQIAVTDLDIVSSSIGLQNLCIVHVLRNGGGILELKRLFDSIYGASQSNRQLAELTLEQARELPFTKVSDGEK